MKLFNIRRSVKVGVFFVALTFFVGCDKDFLDAPQNSLITIPSTLDDFRKLLDAEVYLKETPALGEIGSDDYYMTNEAWNSIFYASERNQYIWAKTIYDGTESVADWQYSYQQVFYANTVLEGLAKLSLADDQIQDWRFLKGAALFIRGYAFYNLSQVFCPVYDEQDAQNPYGVPLRLTPNIDEPTKRSTLLETYDRIVMDIKEARQLLPITISTQFRNRPSRPAADALLARVYLSMRKYDLAKAAADSVMGVYDELLDYNSLSTSASFPFSRLNNEVIYQSNLANGYSILTSIRISNGYFVDSTLYKSYHVNDLRRSIFYSTIPRIKGSYAERPRFSGLATDEIYLIRAECNARSGETQKAMKDLNDLLRTRWKKLNNQSTFSDLQATDAAEALALVLQERRKELVFRGLRWSDLRRLNKEGAGITIKRVLGNETYTLPPNDPRYVLPIPNEVINLSGIEQNPR